MSEVQREPYEIPYDASLDKPMDKPAEKQPTRRRGKRVLTAAEIEKREQNDGHRERQRIKFIESGMDDFFDYEVLEMLLFYTIPQKDTKPLAKRLIKQFGSLSAVLDTPPYVLHKDGGITLNCAVLLSMMPHVLKAYQKAKWPLGKVTIDSPETAVAYARGLFIGETVEAFYLICLDTQRQLIQSELLYRGSVNEIVLYPKDIIAATIKHHAACVIVAHNHPGGNPMPSNEDIRATEAILNAMKVMDLLVVDHIIIAGNKHYSFSQKRLLKMGGNY